MLIPSRLYRLCVKELKETLRDRRTVVTLLLMPVLVYPVLSMAFNRFLLTSGGSATTAYSVGVGSLAEAEILDRWINDPRGAPPPEVIEASGGSVAKFDIKIIDNVDPVEALKLNAIDVAVDIDTQNDVAPPGVVLTAYRGDTASESARRILVERMQWYKLAKAQSVASSAATYQTPMSVSVAEIGEATATSMLGTIVPLVLVLMTITGAVYPAIDLTAGERERGTMEALMASPVRRSSVLIAKYVAVVTVAMATAVANLLAMFTTLWAGRLLPVLTGQDDGFPLPAMLQIFALLLLFSGFFSAILLSLTSFAKSFKEAQAYLIPVMLFSLAPAMLSLLPGVTLQGPLAIAPLINIVLLARDVLSGNVQPTAAVVAVVSTIGYATAALALAAKLFGSDAVSRTSGGSFTSALKRPSVGVAVPTVAAAALMAALLIPIYFLVSNGLIGFLDSQRDRISVAQSLMLNALALIVTFGGVPLAAAWWAKNRYLTTFRLFRPGIVAVCGAVLMGLGSWAFAHEAFVLADQFGLEGLSQEKIEQTRQVLAKWKTVSPVLLLASLALTPAVIEELCFRGYLFSALSKVVSPTATIVTTAVLFGMFHVLTGNALLIERFLPSTLMGLILGYVAFRTGSVIPGMVLHFVHNGLLELVARYHESLTFLGADLDDQTHLPGTWIAIAGGIAVTGLLIVRWGTKPKTPLAA